VIPARLDPDFWRNRRVLVTGHSGFKGAWLWQWLTALGADLSGFSLFPERWPNLFEAAHLGGHPGSRLADLRDAARTRKTMAELAPEIVFHMAGQALVRRSYAQPVYTFETNVLGTANLLEAILATPSVRAAVIVTSDKCYRPNPEVEEYREEDELGGADPYSASKACAEILTEAWRRSFFATRAPLRGVATARGGNVIGGGDWAEDRLVPDCIRAFESGKPLELRSPASRRPWQFVLDALNGYLALAERLFADPGGFSQAWNFGPDHKRSVSVSDVVEKLGEFWKRSDPWIEPAAGAALHEEERLTINSTKARNHLGWRPVLDLDCAIHWTAEWHIRFSRGEDAARLCAEQIGRFEARMRETEI
jgi:CDP-glucose 4,6-dehydratase